MPIPTSVVLTRFSDSSSRTFIPASPDGGGSRRIDSETTLSAPSLIVVRHAVQKPKGGPTIDRTLVQKTNSVIDANEVAQSLTVNLTIQRPRSAAITKAMLIDEIRMNYDFVIAHIDDLLVGAL